MRQIAVEKARDDAEVVADDERRNEDAGQEEEGRLTSDFLVCHCGALPRQLAAHRTSAAPSSSTLQSSLDTFGVDHPSLSTSTRPSSETLPSPSFSRAPAWLTPMPCTSAPLAAHHVFVDQHLSGALPALVPHAPCPASVHTPALRRVLCDYNVNCEHDVCDHAVYHARLTPPAQRVLGPPPFSIIAPTYPRVHVPSEALTRCIIRMPGRLVIGEPPTGTPTSPTRSAPSSGTHSRILALTVTLPA
ncbi:hypothetical protein VTO73DRAFT_6863 [Trametes versicolor]